MYKLLGALIIIFGVCLGLYLGIYVCFYDGIVMLIDGCRQDPVNAGDIAFGIIRVFFAGVVGVGSFALVTVCGVGVFDYRPRKKSVVRGPWDRTRY